MLRLPLSFFGAAVPLPAAGAVVEPPLVLGLPMQAAAIGIAAAAAAPLRSVRRSIFRWVTSSTLIDLPRRNSARLCAGCRTVHSGFRPANARGRLGSPAERALS